MHEVVDWWTRGPEPCEHARGNVDSHAPTHGRDAARARRSRCPRALTLRNFEAHRDEEAWLEENNAAFAHHPEQGAWSMADLDERTHEPWFDPSGFLVLEIDGRLAASCWTKVHELHPDRFGEIYVVSVHPDFQGHHLGRVMVTQGLNVLYRKGVTHAVLFVDESNESGAQALRLPRVSSRARGPTHALYARLTHAHGVTDAEGDGRGERHDDERP